MKNTPKLVYLNIGTDDTTDFNELHEVTWSKDEVYKSDLKFLSVDFISRRVEELKEQRINFTENTTQQTDLISRVKIKTLLDLL